MIKINLLPQKRAKRPQMSTEGQGPILAGMGGLLAVAAGVFFLVHTPRASELSDLKTTNGGLNRDIQAKSAKLKDYEALKAAVEAARERKKAIELLLSAKQVPAHIIHELGEILTPGRTPTMSQMMAAQVSDGPKGDPNRRFASDWDPKHVWITSFKEKAGSFILEGGAQSDPDVTQLAKRLQASVYFRDVTPQGGRQITDRDSSVTYYTFTITGKVVY